MRIWPLTLLLLSLPASAEPAECTAAEELCEIRCQSPLEETDEASDTERCLQACEAKANACRTPASE